MRHLVSDIGGTNARFAMVDNHGLPANEKTLKTKDFPGVVEAAQAYLDGQPVDNVVLVVAGPVEQDRIGLTNCPWTFSLEETKMALGALHLIAINDFVAQALAIPKLGAADQVKLSGGEAIEGPAGRRDRSWHRAWGCRTSQDRWCPSPDCDRGWSRRFCTER